MAQRMSKEAIAAIYARVSSPDKLLYHVANGRRENSDTDYDGEALIATSQRRVQRDIARIKAASSIFLTRSLPRATTSVVKQETE